MKIHCIQTGPFGVNTYLLCANNGDCAIIDPSCYDPQEKLDLKGNYGFLSILLLRQILPSNLAHPDWAKGAIN